MKRLVIIPTILLFCILLTACRDRADQEGPWIGIAPGSDLADVTERTEYYDLVVETEELFDLGLWERNPEEYLTYRSAASLYTICWALSLQKGNRHSSGPKQLLLG